MLTETTLVPHLYQPAVISTFIYINKKIGTDFLPYITMLNYLSYINKEAF